MPTFCISLGVLILETITLCTPLLNVSLGFNLRLLGNVIPIFEATFLILLPEQLYFSLSLRNLVYQLKLIVLIFLFLTIILNSF